VLSECERVNEVDLRIYSHIFKPDLHQYILIACVSEKVKSDMIDRLCIPYDNSRLKKNTSWCPSLQSKK